MSNIWICRSSSQSMIPGRNTLKLFLEDSPAPQNLLWTFPPSSLENYFNFSLYESQKIFPLDCNIKYDDIYRFLFLLYLLGLWSRQTTLPTSKRKKEKKTVWGQRIGYTLYTCSEMLWVNAHAWKIILSTVKL